MCDHVVGLSLHIFYQISAQTNIDCSNKIIDCREMENTILLTYFISKYIVANL
jgi:hypothetical protein